MKTFLQNKGIKGGIFMMVFYQVIMIVIFMSGYSAIPKNATELTVAIVNEDEQNGAEFANQIKEQLPFHIITDVSLEQAQIELEDRDIHFIMHIPQGFTEKLSAQGEQAQMDFFINESNPATVNGIVKNIASEITSKLSVQLQTQSFEAMFQNMNISEEQSQQMVEGVMTKLKSNVVITNPQPAGMHDQMAPMFLTMAGYVGAMIYSMISIGVLNHLKGRLGKWKAFLSLQGVNVLLSIITPLIGIGIYFAIHGYGTEVFMKLWMVNALEMLVAIEFTSIFCMLFGQAGMILNLPVLLSQTIANGAVVARDMMPGYFQVFSYISPMFYTVQLNYNMLFGGGKTAELLLGLALVGIVALLLNTIIHHFKAVKVAAE